MNIKILNSKPNPFSEFASRLHLRSILMIGFILLPISDVKAQVFQFAAEAETKKGPRMAYLWVPPQSAKIKGVVIGGMTLIERELAKDTQIREACKRNDLAILFIKSGLKSVPLQDVLNQFSTLSGYKELRDSPVFFIGHSAGGPQAKHYAIEWSKRCFGLVQYRGADPGGDIAVPPGIPALMIVGQFDEFGKIGRNSEGVENWEKDRDKMVAYRKANPRNIGNFLVEPGAGHFAWSNRCAKYLASFIEKAAQARIPSNWPQSPLNEIEMKTGYLSDSRLEESEKHETTSYSGYQGDRDSALWHFDQEMAELAREFLTGLNLKDQFIKWENPHWVQAGARNYLTKVQWESNDTFKVIPTYRKTYPTQIKGKGSRWGKAGEKSGNAETPIFVKPVSGPLKRVGNGRLKIQYDALAPATENKRISFMAWSNGNSNYRYTECVGMLNSKEILIRDGAEQKIKFEIPSAQELTQKGYQLQAQSDQGLPVQFHIAYGPAIIKDNKVYPAEIPIKATFPIEIKIIAYQIGNRTQPKVKTAEPVLQSLLVIKK